MAGTAAHEIGATLIDRASRGNNSTKAIEFVDRPASNGVIWTLEMFEAAQLYAEDVATVMRNTGVFGGQFLNIEQQIKAPNIHELSYGTPDCWLFDWRNGRLYIWDLKFGRRVVEVFENWPLMNYVAGIIKYITDQLSITHPEMLKDITVHMRIVQPRAFHREGPIREWVTKASNLRGYFNILHTNAAIALGPNAVCRSGDHCRDCSARHACSAALTGGVQLYEAAAKPTPIEMSPEAIGVQLTIIKRARRQLEYLESGFDEQVKSLIRSGKLVPNWALENHIGSAKWTKPIKEVIALGKLLDIDLKKPDAVKTPTQARKLGIDDAVINAYSEKPNTGLRLVPDDGSTAKRIFSK